MKINNRRSFICGIKGKKLKNNEISFLKKYKPWGIILFSRNIGSLDQTKKLTKNIKNIFKDKNYPILIDEEGGTVSRLKNFIDSSIFSANFFGNLYAKDKKKFYLYLEIYVNQISYLLRLLGVNLNSVPVLDLKRSITHKIIKDRSYSSNPKIISEIGDYIIFLFHKNRIGTIIKHIPGHGLSRNDSHINRCYIDKKFKYLKKNDFFPFKKKTSIFAMTGHLIFQKIDPLNAVTHSKKMINLIRKEIGFKNLIISDDLSMKSLNYSLSKSTQKAFTAGCNLVLHCNGRLLEMLDVAKNSPKVSKLVIKKTSQFNDIIS